MKITKYPGFVKTENSLIFLILAFPFLSENYTESKLIYWSLIGLYAAILFIPLIGRGLLNRKYADFEYRYDATLPSESLFSKNFFLKLTGGLVLTLGLLFLADAYFPNMMKTIVITAMIIYALKTVVEYFSIKNEDEEEVTSLRMSADKLLVVKNYYVNEFLLKDIKKIQISGSDFTIVEEVNGNTVERVYSVVNTREEYLHYFKQKIDELANKTIVEFSGKQALSYE